MFTSDCLVDSRARTICCIAGMAVMTLSFVVGINRIPQILLGELNPHGSRAIVSSYAYMSGSLITIVNTLFYYPAHNALHEWVWTPFLSAQIATILILYFYLPETSGRRVDEIVGQWMSGGRTGVVQQRWNTI